MTSNDAQSRITRFWSMVASGYEAHPGNVPARDSAEYAAWVDAIRELLPPAPADVLDVATGTGFVAVIAAKLGYHVTAIDASPEMLDQARANAAAERVELTLDVRDAVEPGFEAGSFDAITCRHFLWTLREPRRAFRNWHRILRPGGRVVAIDGFWFAAAEDPAKDDTPGIFEQAYTRETRRELPVMAMSSAEEVAPLFRDAGFDVVIIGDLAQVHARAKEPPSAEPWYTIVAKR